MKQDNVVVLSHHRVFLVEVGRGQESRVNLARNDKLVDVVQHPLCLHSLSKSVELRLLHRRKRLEKTIQTSIVIRKSIKVF